MYAIAGRLATGVATIIITDILMEKYDVSAKVKERYTQARARVSGLTAQVWSPHAQAQSAAKKAEAQETPRLTWRERLTIREAGLQLRLARRANDKANRKVAFWIAHARYCQETENAYRRNYLDLVPLEKWMGPEDEGEVAHV